MNFDEIKTIVEIIQGVVTTIGILLAGIWTYYTFVRSRSFAPNVRINFELKQVVELKRGRGAIVRISVKNIGKTKVGKKTCSAKAQAVVEPRFVVDPIEFVRVDRSLKYTINTYSILEDLEFLEPNEQVEEDVLFFLDRSTLFKVGVRVEGEANSAWSSSAIFDARLCE